MDNSINVAYNKFLEVAKKANKLYRENSTEHEEAKAEMYRLENDYYALLKEKANPKVSDNQNLIAGGLRDAFSSFLNPSI